MTISVTLNNVSNLQETTSSQNTINGNMTTITSAFESALDTAGDTMDGSLDMNSNHIINLPTPSSAEEPLRLQDLNSFLNGGTISNIPSTNTAGLFLESTSTPYTVEWTTDTPVTSVTNDTNVTGSVASGDLTLGWTGTLAADRLNSDVVQSVTNGTNVTGSVSDQNLTLGWTGTLSGTDGGTGVNNGSNTLTLGGSLTTTGTQSATLALGDTTSTYTFPTASATVLSTAGAAHLYTPSNPSSTTSTSKVMCGLGSTCTITPLYSSRIFVQFIFFINNNTASDGSECQIYYGTGTAPSNGASATGTSEGSASGIINTADTAGLNLSMTCAALITGLTPGTAYWLDLSQMSVTGGTTEVANVACIVYEM